MHHHLSQYRRECVADFIKENRPVSVKEVAEHMHNARHTDNKLFKSVSDDPQKCYATTAKDVQKLRKLGAVPYDAIIFRIERCAKPLSSKS